MTEYRVYIVRKDLGEIIPRRVMDRAMAKGQWFKHVIHVMPRKSYGYKTKLAAGRALDRQARTFLDIEDWRGLIWEAGRENEPAETVAI